MAAAGGGMGTSETGDGEMALPCTGLVKALPVTDGDIGNNFQDMGENTTICMRESISELR